MTVYRKVSPNEISQYSEHLMRLDKEDRYSRFAGTISNDAIEQYCRRLDWRYTIILGYFHHGILRAAAEVRTESKMFPERAELAFSVERLHQGQGVGSSLMRRSLTIARNRGIAHVDMLCLQENRRMRMLARKFFTRVAVENGEVGAALDLARPNHMSFMLEAIEDGADAFTFALDQLRPTLSLPKLPFIPVPARATPQARRRQ